MVENLLRIFTQERFEAPAKDDAMDTVRLLMSLCCCGVCTLWHQARRSRHLVGWYRVLTRQSVPSATATCWRTKHQPRYLLPVGCLPPFSWPCQVCNNATCGRAYHNACLLEWLMALPDARRSFQTVFGECPFCQATMAVTMAGTMA